MEKFVHKCLYHTGDAELEHSETVEPYEVEKRTKCLFCGNVKATHEQIVAHMYKQLIND